MLEAFLARGIFPVFDLLKIFLFYGHDAYLGLVQSKFRNVFAFAHLQVRCGSGGLVKCAFVAKRTRYLNYISYSNDNC